MLTQILLIAMTAKMETASQQELAGDSGIPPSLEAPFADPPNGNEPFTVDPSIAINQDSSTTLLKQHVSGNLVVKSGKNTPAKTGEETANTTNSTFTSSTSSMTQSPLPPGENGNKLVQPNASQPPPTQSAGKILNSTQPEPSPNADGSFGLAVVSPQQTSDDTNPPAESPNPFQDIPENDLPTDGTNGEQATSELKGVSGVPSDPDQPQNADGAATQSNPAPNTTATDMDEAQMTQANPTSNQTGDFTQDTESGETIANVPVEPNIDSGAESFGFDPIYMLALIPILLVALLYAWFASPGKKKQKLANAEGHRGKFKRSDRLQKSPDAEPGLTGDELESEQRAKDENREFDFSDDDNEKSPSDQTVSPSAPTKINLDIDDDIFESESRERKKTVSAKQDSSHGKSDSFITKTDFSVTTEAVSKFDLDGLEFEEQDKDKLLFGEDKEAEFDRLSDEEADHLQNQSSPAEVDPESPTAEFPPPATGEEQPDSSETKKPGQFSGWRKKTFANRNRTSQAKQASTVTTAGKAGTVRPAAKSVPPQPEKQTSLEQELEEAPVAESSPDDGSKTVFAEFTVVEPGNFDVDAGSSVLDDDDDQLIEAEHSDFGLANFDTAADPGVAPPVTFGKGKRTVAADQEITVQQDSKSEKSTQKSSVEQQGSGDSGFQPPGEGEFRTVPEPDFANFLSMPQTTDRPQPDQDSELAAKVETLRVENQALTAQISSLEEDLELSTEQSKIASILQEQQLDLQQQLVTVQQKLSTAEEQNKSLDRQLIESKAEADALNQLTVENETLQQQLQEKETSFTKLKQQLQSADAENADMAARVGELTSVQEQLELSNGVNEELHQQISEKVEQETGLRKRLKEAESVADQLQTERVRYQELTTKFDVRDKENQSLQERLNAFEQEQKELIQDLSKLETIESQLETASGTIDELNEKLAVAAVENVATRNRLDAAKDAAQKLERDETSQIQNLEKELDAANVQQASLLQQLEELKSGGKELESANQEIAKLSKQLKAAKTKNKETDKQLRAAKKATQQLQDESSQIQDLQKELAAAKAQQTQLTEQVQNLESKDAELEEVSMKFADISSELETANKQNKELDTYLAELRDVAKQVEELTTQNHDLRNQLESAVRDNDVWEMRLSESSKNAEQTELLTSQNDELQEKLQTMEQEEVELNKRLESEAAQVRELEGLKPQLESMETEILKLREQLSTAQADAAKPEASETPDAEPKKELISEKTKRKFTRLYRAYERERKKRKGLEDNLLEAEHQRDQLTVEFKSLKQNAEDTSSGGAADRQLAKLESQNKKLAERIEKLSQELDDSPAPTESSLNDRLLHDEPGVSGDIEAVTSRLRTTEATLFESQQETSALKHEVEQLQESVAKHQDVIAELESLKTRLQDQQEQLRLEAAKKAELANKLSARELLIEELQSDLPMSSTEGASPSDVEQQLRNQIQEREQMIVRIESERLRAMDRLRELSGDDDLTQLPDKDTANQG